MAKNKLKRFVDMARYSNVIEPQFDELFGNSFRLKGQWNKEVFGNDNPIVVELGCGKGEYTIGLARKYPDKNFIAVDIKGARMWVGASEALKDNLLNVVFLRTRIEFIRSCFDKDELSEIWITFPDPQPQKTRENKRLTSLRFLQSYKQILKPEGFVHLKTDSESLFDYTCNVLKQNDFNILLCTNDLYNSGYTDDILSIQTHYEKIFSEKGFTIKYLKFQI
jgi:tRNA (guanine-N7-)-methyltransferase